MCIFQYDGGGITQINFIVKNKKSDENFEIELTDPNNKFDFIYGF